MCFYVVLEGFGSTAANKDWMNEQINRLLSLERKTRLRAALVTKQTDLSLTKHLL